MQTLRMLVGAVVAALFLMAVALSVVLGFAAPPLWSVVLLLVIGAVVHLALDRVGYRLPPVSPTLPAEEARTVAVRAFQGSLMRRLPAASGPPAAPASEGSSGPAARPSPGSPDR